MIYENVLFTDDHIILTATYPTPQEHKHFAKHLLFGIHGELICSIGGQMITGKGLYIASNVPHTARVTRGYMLVLLVEHTSEFSTRLDAVLQSESFCLLQDDLVKDTHASYRTNDLEGVQETIFQAFEVTHRDSGRYDR
ncbi:MAG: hypothetical protein GX096_12355 [Clostridiales bacterium]|nr:hypothetical protein [Clostridiales bacterium]